MVPQGYLPLTQGCRLSILLEKPSTARFVAISHVRSVGLGNDRKTSLPFCQLTLIQVLVNQIDPPQNEQTDTSFWIDTMACPLT